MKLCQRLKNNHEYSNPTWEQLKKQAIKRLKTSHALSGKDGALTPIIKMGLTHKTVSKVKK